MNSIIRILTINIFVILLSACGGGAGSGDVDEANNTGSNNTGNTGSTPSSNTNPTPSEMTGYASVKSDLSVCMTCHKAGGIAGGTKLLFVPGDDVANIAVLKAYMTAVSRSTLLGKSIGQPSHAGGNLFGSTSSTAYKNFEAYLISLESSQTPAPTPGTPTPTPTPTPGTPAPTPTPTMTLNRSVIQAKCVSCHSATGAARSTALIFRTGDTAADVAYNEGQLKTYMAGRTNGGQIVLDKPRGLLGHGGGALLALGSAEYTLLANFVAANSSTPTTPPPATPPPTSGAPFTLESPEQTYRRASLYLTGTIPSISKMQSMQNADDATLRTEILNLMQGNGFKEFLKNGANARLNSRHLRTSDAGARFYNKYYLPNVSNSERRSTVRRDLAEEPLEIIANVVMNNRPYSEILTANYTMVGQYTDESYNTGLTVPAGSFQQAQNMGQDVKTPGTFGSDATGASRITNFPHAGVLSTWSYLSKYGTTATNRNRARARWTMYHFLGFDIEKSASRTISLMDVADEVNPTMNNPACTVCHTTLDPIAGAFKFFHERNGYKAWGTDSLDRRYRQRNPGVDWYQDMLPAGYGSATATGDPLQWLARQIVADSRFATGAVKFWWFAVFGEDVLDSSAPALQYNRQQAVITQLADNFRPSLNLKQLLADMMMTDYFRAAKKTDATMADSNINIHMNGRRLLTGTELKNKTASLTGITWGGNNPRLEGEYKMLFGGTDDVVVEKRATDLSSMMFRVAERHANEIGCAAVVYDFSLPQAQRRLFTQVENNTLDEASIRSQLVVLFERMLNRVVTPTSAEVSQAYQLFLDLRQARINAGGGTRVDSNTRCDNRIGGSTNDPSFVMSPWRGLIIALMTDPDYLYE